MLSTNITARVTLIPAMPINLKRVYRDQRCSKGREGAEPLLKDVKIFKSPSPLDTRVSSLLILESLLEELNKELPRNSNDSLNGLIVTHR